MTILSGILYQILHQSSLIKLFYVQCACITTKQVIMVLTNYLAHTLYPLYENIFASSAST